MRTLSTYPNHVVWNNFYSRVSWKNGKPFARSHEWTLLERKITSLTCAIDTEKRISPGILVTSSLFAVRFSRKYRQQMQRLTQAVAINRVHWDDVETKTVPAVWYYNPVGKELKIISVLQDFPTWSCNRPQFSSITQPTNQHQSAPVLLATPQHHPIKQKRMRNREKNEK